MYNVDELEKKWFRYRRKKLRLPIVMLAIVGGSMLMVPKLLDIKGNILDGNISINGVEATSWIQNAINGSNNVHLAKLSTEVPSMEINAKEHKEKSGQIVFNEKDSNNTIYLKKRKKIHIEVIEKGNSDIAKDIEDRFNFAKDKSDSLFLAKYYYDKKEYKKAERWALETNKIDNTIEESWIIFAKVLSKQGKRADAIKILQAYFNDSNSVKAKTLMDKIRLGKD